MSQPLAIATRASMLVHVTSWIAGLGLGYMTCGGGFVFFGCEIPHWLGAALSLAIPTMMLLSLVLPVSAIVRPLWHRWRESRRQPGLCYTCGYDLRATPERCPECGTFAKVTTS
jgi:hypothetical protein